MNNNVVSLPLGSCVLAAALIGAIFFIGAPTAQAQLFQPEGSIDKSVLYQPDGATSITITGSANVNRVTLTVGHGSTIVEILNGIDLRLAGGLPP